MLTTETIDATINNENFLKWAEFCEEMNDPNLTDEKEGILVDSIADIEDGLSEAELEAWMEAAS